MQECSVLSEVYSLELSALTKLLPSLYLIPNAIQSERYYSITGSSNRCRKLWSKRTFQTKAQTILLNYWSGRLFLQNLGKGSLKICILKLYTRGFTIEFTRYMAYTSQKPVV